MENIVIAYKEVGKKPVFMNIENSIESFEKLLKDEIKIIQFDNYTIVYKKHSQNLEPNIWVETNFFSLGETIRGTVFLVNRDEKRKFYHIEIRTSKEYKRFD